MSGLTYVITAANRSIGKAILKTLILHPNTTVIAAVQNVASSTKALSSSSVGPGSKLIIVKIDLTLDSDPATAVEELQTEMGTEAAKSVGMAEALMTMEESLSGLILLIDSASLKVTRTS